MTTDLEKRYQQKVRDFCGGLDPYCVDCKVSTDPLPRDVGYFDVCNFCIDRDSAYTKESLKAYKTLESYLFFESGWIQSVWCKNVSSGSIVIGKVSVFHGLI